MDESWRTMFDAYDSTSMALSRRDDDWLIRIFQVHSGWRVGWQTEETVYFVRVDVPGSHEPVPLYL